MEQQHVARGKKKRTKISPTIDTSDALEVTNLKWIALLPAVAAANPFGSETIGFVDGGLHHTFPAKKLRFTSCPRGKVCQDRINFYFITQYDQMMNFR